MPVATPVPADVAAKPDQRPAEEETPEIIEANDEPLTEDSFAKAWAVFWEQPERTMKQKSVRNNSYSLDIASQTFTISVISTIQQDIVGELRDPIMRSLRKQLGKPELKMESQLVEATQERRPYTNQEKLQALLEKQPLLQDMVDKLGLDPDL